MMRRTARETDCADVIDDVDADDDDVAVVAGIALQIETRTMAWRRTAVALDLSHSVSVVGRERPFRVSIDLETAHW